MHRRATGHPPVGSDPNTDVVIQYSWRSGCLRLGLATVLCILVYNSMRISFSIVCVELLVYRVGESLIFRASGILGFI
jgi:hypothetical protein